MTKERIEDHLGRTRFGGLLCVLETIDLCREGERIAWRRRRLRFDGGDRAPDPAHALSVRLGTNGRVAVASARQQTGLRRPHDTPSARHLRSRAQSLAAMRTRHNLPNGSDAEADRRTTDSVGRLERDAVTDLEDRLRL